MSEIMAALEAGFFKERIADLEYRLRRIRELARQEVRTASKDPSDWAETMFSIISVSEFKP